MTQVVDTLPKGPVCLHLIVNTLIANELMTQLDESTARRQLKSPCCIYINIELSAVLGHIHSDVLVHFNSLNFLHHHMINKCWSSVDQMIATLWTNANLSSITNIQISSDQLLTLRMWYGDYFVSSKYNLCLTFAIAAVYAASCYEWPSCNEAQL